MYCAMIGLGGMGRAISRNLRNASPGPRSRRGAGGYLRNDPERVIDADLVPGVSRITRWRANRARAHLAWVWAIIVLAGAALALMVSGAL